MFWGPVTFTWGTEQAHGSALTSLSSFLWLPAGPFWSWGRFWVNPMALLTLGDLFLSPISEVTLISSTFPASLVLDKTSYIRLMVVMFVQIVFQKFKDTSSWWNLPTLHLSLSNCLMDDLFWLQKAPNPTLRLHQHCHFLKSPEVDYTCASHWLLHFVLPPAIFPHTLDHPASLLSNPSKP